MDRNGAFHGGSLSISVAPLQQIVSFGGAFFE